MTFEIKDDPPCFRKPCVSGNTHFLKDKKKKTLSLRYVKFIHMT